ncbi:hypothetical protein [Amantichitinum ursilacus]|uniref:Uncharacterized protein n=1 Tax=Amantichitinum ursilacus TaxID=857265 RepID=A0A0N0XH00_9NEIS|nr:hypothetical protein [Amantichitinum ursilacus]KPC50431.1 hypothetical protein WG78_17525 [Amantichitinum ursilacus]
MKRPDFRLLTAVAVAAALLAACAAPPKTEPKPQLAPIAPAPLDPTRALTVFYVQTRDLPSAELSKRALELGNGIQTPDVTLRQAILLGHTHNPADTARAITLTESVIKADNGLKPYAQLLNAMWTERRKLEDQIDKQTAAGKDAQKRADQLKQQLDALKAVERDLAKPVPGASKGD